MYKIKYLESSVLDMDEIFDYISLDSQFYALKVLININNTIKYLEIFPYIWIEISNWLRMFVESKYKYKVIYKINWSIIEIVSIFKNKDNY